jgi:putative peptidoglycan lipid II flippase
VAVGTALLPLLARQLRTGQALSAHRSINRAVELSLLLTVPAAVGLAVASGAIIAALFQRGAFGAMETQASSAALVAYAFGLPAFVLVKVFAPAFFARGDTATPVKIGLLAVALNLGFNVVLMGPLQHVGVALSTALAAWVNALLLAWVLLRRRAYVMDRRARRALPRILAAAAAMGVTVAALGFVLPAGADSIARALRAAVLIGFGAAVFLGAGLALRAFDPREVLRMLRRRRSNGA